LIKKGYVLDVIRKLYLLQLSQNLTINGIAVRWCSLQLYSGSKWEGTWDFQLRYFIECNKSRPHEAFMEYYSFSSCVFILCVNADLARRRDFEEQLSPLIKKIFFSSLSLLFKNLDVCLAHNNKKMWVRLVEECG